MTKWVWFNRAPMKESEHLHRTKAGEAFLQLCLCGKGIQMGHEESSWSTFLKSVEGEHLQGLHSVMVL